MPRLTYMEYFEDDINELYERYEAECAYIDAEWQSLYDEIVEELNNGTIE